MEAIPLPAEAAGPASRVARFGPPPGVSEDDCYSHDAIVGPWPGPGPFDGAPSITVFVALDDEDLAALNAHETPTLQLTLLTGALPPWILAVADYGTADHEQADLPPRKTRDPLDQHREHEEWWGCAGKFVCVSCGQAYVREGGEWFIVPRGQDQP